MTPEIRIRNLGKTFLREGEMPVDVLREVNLDIAHGSFVALVGRSGCGKSTLLNIVAGLVPPTNGNVAFADGSTQWPRRDVGYMTQKDTLMPWRTVLSNVAMPLEVRGSEKRARESAARDLLGVVGLAHAAERFPRELSGGMMRRASLARMLVANPGILLLDEPFGALDPQLRSELQRELLKLWSNSGKTVVFVTHDIDEALVVADRVVCLHTGGEIVLDLEVNLPRPRDPRDVRRLPEFVALHDRLLHAIGGVA